PVHPDEPAVAESGTLPPWMRPEGAAKQAELPAAPDQAPRGEAAASPRGAGQLPVSQDPWAWSTPGTGAGKSPAERWDAGRLRAGQPSAWQRSADEADTGQATVGHVAETEPPATEPAQGEQPPADRAPVDQEAQAEQSPSEAAGSDLTSVDRGAG